MGVKWLRHRRRDEGCDPENGIITPLEMYTNQ